MVLPREQILADGVTEFPWEREGIEFLKNALPATEPYRLWALVELVEPSGRRHEIDALVLGYNALYLLELKAHPARFSGNSVDWTVEWKDGHRTHMENPMNLASKKARVLASLLERELRGRSTRPRVEALVFLSHEHADTSGLDSQGRLGVVTRKDLAKAITSGEFAGAHSSVRERIVLSPVARETVLALKRLGITASRGAMKINNILVNHVIDEGAGFQDHLGEHEVLKSKSRVRIYLVPQATSEEGKERLNRAAVREARILTALSHPNVLKCTDFISTGPTGGPALVFEHDPAFERLDAFVRKNPDLSFNERLEIVQRVGEALAFCHSKNVLHRGLEPQSVLVKSVERSAEGRKTRGVDVKLYNFQLAVGANTDGTRHLGSIGDSAAFRAPELMSDPTKASEASDVFSLGALAWFVFVGRAPVKDLVEQHEVLARDGCYALSAASDALGAARAGDGVATAAGAERVRSNRDLDELVRAATALRERVSSVTEFLDQLALVRPDATEQRAVIDARAGDVLHADDGTELRVEKLLGAGASAKVFRVTLHGGTFAMKVALDRRQDEAIEAESELLERVQGDRIVRRHRKLYFDRRLVLLLDDAGETLADVLAARGPLGIDDAMRWGEDLLLAVQRLEELGVVHKDIKPANLGVAVDRAGRSTHGKLFDFSLAASSPEDIEVGTVAYRDPFLPFRKRWDHAADRYSAASTLYEMLTGARVRFGRDDLPLGTSDEATLDADRFDPAVREPLVQFFTQCFARDTAARFADADAMRRAWNDLFARRSLAPIPPAPNATRGDVADDPADDAPRGRKGAKKNSAEPSLVWTDAALDAISAKSSIESLPLSTRAKNALDRAGMLSFGELRASTKARLQALDGVGKDTLREILALREAHRARTGSTGASSPAMPAVTASAGATEVRSDEASEPSIDRWIEAFVPKAKSARGWAWVSTARILFGLDDGIPVDAATVAERRRVSRQAVYIQLQNAREYWRSLAEHEALTVRVLDLLAQRGDVATVDRLASDVLLSFGELADERSRPRLTAARALVDIVRLTATAARDGDARLLWDAMLHGRWWVAADRALLDPLRAMASAADELATRAVLASGEDARSVIVERAVETPFVRWGVEGLLSLAAEASRTAACSARLEVYPRGMSAAKALRLCSAVLGESMVDEARLRAVVKSRYPLAEELPTGDALVALVQSELGLEVDPSSGGFRRPVRADATNTPTVSQVADLRRAPKPIVAKGALRALATTDTAAREFDERVRVAARRGTFRVVEVDADSAPRAARALAARLETADRSLDAELIAAIRELAERDGIAWEAIRKTDREGPTGEDWPLLVGLAKDAARSVLARWSSASERERGAIVLRDLGLAARYGLREFLDELVALARSDDGPAVFLVLARMQDQGEAPIDGGALPGLTVPNPFAVARLHPPESWLSAVG